jgi:hypothetical protein
VYLSTLHAAVRWLCAVVLWAPLWAIVGHGRCRGRVRVMPFGRGPFPDVYAWGMYIGCKFMIGGAYLASWLCVARDGARRCRTDVTYAASLIALSRAPLCTGAVVVFVDSSGNERRRQQRPVWLREVILDVAAASNWVSHHLSKSNGDSCIHGCILLGGSMRLHLVRLTRAVPMLDNRLAL